MSKRDQWRHVVFKMTSRGSETMSRSRLIRIERSRSQNDRENSSTTSKTRATHFLVYTSWWRHRISVVDVGKVLGPENLVALRQGHGGLAVGHVGGMNNIPAWLLWDYYHLPLYSPRSRLKWMWSSAPLRKGMLVLPTLSVRPGAGEGLLRHHHWIHYLIAWCLMHFEVAVSVNQLSR